MINLNSLTTTVDIPTRLESELNAASAGSASESKFGDLDKRGLGKVAEDFESVFLSLMLKEMRNTLDQSSGGLFGSEGSDTYGGMFDMLMGQSLAKERHLGIADLVEKNVNRYAAQQQLADEAVATDEPAQ